MIWDLGRHYLTPSPLLYHSSPQRNCKEDSKKRNGYRPDKQLYTPNDKHRHHLQRDHGSILHNHRHLHHRRHHYHHLHLYHHRQCLTQSIQLDRTNVILLGIEHCQGGNYTHKAYKAMSGKCNGDGDGDGRDAHLQLMALSLKPQQRFAPKRSPQLRNLLSWRPETTHTPVWRQGVNPLITFENNMMC